MNVVKRVISSPDQIGRNPHPKISKISAQHVMSHARHSPVGEDHNAPIEEMNTDVPSYIAAENKSAAETMTELYSTPISDDEASSGHILESRYGGNNNPKEAQTPSASTTRTSSVSSFHSKNRSESETRSDTTGDTTMKDWGWFDDINDDNDGSTQMTDGNDKEDNMKKRMKSNFIDDGKATSLVYDIGSDTLVSSLIDDDTQTNEIEDMSITSGRAGEKRKGKKKKKRMLELEFDHLDGPLDGIVNNTKKDETTSMAVTAPMYVLEESPSVQTLWRDTAGNRPPQPIEERSFYESMWVQNFERSQVKYHMPVDVLAATTPISLSPFADGNFANVGNTGDTSYSVPTDNTQIGEGKYSSGTGGGLPGGYGETRAKLGPYDHHHTVVNKAVKDHETGDDLTVLVKGDNVFGTTVSKSFLTNGNMPGPVESVSISVGSYRVVESKKHGKYAQFLVIFCAGTFRDTIGVWKRYSDFNKLSHQVTHGTESCTSVLVGMGPLSVTEDPPEIMPNAMTSWSLVKKRKRWYRCLDAGYLSIKVFLLERFLHDILYESTSLDILRDFVGVAE